MAVAVCVDWSVRAQGAYFPTVWPQLGGVVLVATFALLLTGRRVSRELLLAAGAIALFGAWCLLSVTWGGIPDVAWSAFDQFVLAAAALLLGGLVAGRTGTRLLAIGVVGGVTLEAVELLYRLQKGPVSAEWFDGRKVQGPVGYANAQGALVALGILLALWLVTDGSLTVRVGSGAALGVLLGALLLTQSRGAMLAVCAAAALQVGLRRDARTAGVALLLGLYGAVLWRPLRAVDRALVGKDVDARVAAFRHDVRWVVLGVVVFALVAATPPRRQLFRRGLLAAAVAALLVAFAASLVLRPDELGKLRSALATHALQEPVDLPGGETRLSSVALSGRVKIWRVAWRVYSEHPGLGVGKGTFAREWDRRRTDHNLSVLQPHSIELEALSELGVPGLLLFVAFVGLAVAALARARAGTAAVGASVLALLILQASVDWTLSFPALVVPACVLIGAAAPAVRARAPGIRTHAAVVVAAALAAVSFGLPYLSARALVAAQHALAADPARAWTLARRARGYDRWNAEAADVQARAAAAAREPLAAVELYARAAELSQRPWREEFARATLLARIGLRRDSLAACRIARAESPIEQTLQYGLCGAAG